MDQRLTGLLDPGSLHGIARDFGEPSNRLSSIRYGSVCSGIEAATVAWHPLGWQPQFFSEIDAAPRAVLSHHYPEVPLHGDFTTIQDGQYGAIDLLVGGTPCQSFSVAGLRGGLADDRGNLALQYLRLAQRLRPRWLVWENVPGVLSSSGGRDFGAILGGMVELGYGFAYRVLDAQYIRVDGFGRAVPQRRRRVFVVGYLGDWRRAAAVLFERASLRGDLAPRRSPGKIAAASLTGSLGRRCGVPDGGDTEGHLVVACLNGISEYGGDVPTLRAKGGDAAGGSEALIAFDTTQITSAANRSNPQPGDPCHPLASGAHPPAIALPIPILEVGKGSTSRGSGPNGSGLGQPGDPMFTLQAGAQHGVMLAEPSYADAAQTRSDQALRALRDAVGEEAFAEWGSGVVAALRTQKILRSGVHGESVRCAPDDRHELDDDALPCPEAGGAGCVRTLWEAGCVGRPPPRWQPSERLARELGADLSKLPQQGASAERFMLSLWRAGEGLGLLREALSALQKVRRPADDQSQPAPTRWVVRRLTPLEAERLQGFPDGYTLVPTARGMMADGPRYKALGNSMAVNAMRWIGRRIEAVEAISTQARRQAA